MFRRYFLWQVLLGWLLAIGIKTGISTEQKPESISDNNDIEPFQIKPIVFFVATNGKDSWSGKQATPNIDNSDGPFATWKRVQTAIRAIKQGNEVSRPIKIIFNQGTYQLTEPIIFTPEDSGTKFSPITYQAAPQEQVTISGGQVIKGWQEQQLNGLRLWTANLPASFKEINFQHLWVNGARRVRARYPSQGYFKIESVFHRQNQKWHEGDRKFRYHLADIPKNIQPKSSEAVVMNRWIESRLPISNIDHQQNTLHFEKESVFKLVPGDLYYLEGAWEFLDTPGEWYLDREQSRLYYLPKIDEKIADTEVVAPLLDALMLFAGEASQKRLVSDLKFENLIFAHTDWHLPEQESGYSHNAWGVPGAITANGISNCCWRDCTFKHLGNYGIELFRGCQYNQIIGCSLYDLGAGGIKIGERESTIQNILLEEVSHHNLITHNHIYDAGKFFCSGVGIRAVHSHNNLIAYNHVHDLYYTGISVRGTWGFQVTQAYENVIEYNYVHHIGRLSNGEGAILSDMGAIYNLGSQAGTVIRHNTIHDVDGLRYGGWGIYLDQGSSYLVIEHNLVYRTSDGSFCQHYGKDNRICHNIFAFGKTTQIHRNQRDLKTSLRKNLTSFYFENNVVYWQEGEFITGLEANYQSNVVFEHNIYWKVDDPNVLFGGLSWTEWQKSDRHSQVIDPLFVAPEQGNFQLKPNSAVKVVNQ
jgi:hypothetical protein